MAERKELQEPKGIAVVEQGNPVFMQVNCYCEETPVAMLAGMTGE